MPNVNLEDSEWSQVISAIASSVPLIQKISQQLMAQRQQTNTPRQQPQGNSGEHHVPSEPAAR
jgi:hypothetical protein